MCSSTSVPRCPPVREYTPHLWANGRYLRRSEGRDSQRHGYHRTMHVTNYKLFAFQPCGPLPIPIARLRVLSLTLLECYSAFMTPVIEQSAELEASVIGAQCAAIGR